MPDVLGHEYFGSEDFQALSLEEKARQYVDEFYYNYERGLEDKFEGISDFSKGVLLAPVKTVGESVVGYAQLGDLAFDYEEVSKDLSHYARLSDLDRSMIRAQVSVEKFFKKGWTLF